ncbi:hypothetical protein BMW22_15770 [Rhizobium leguminosarum]|uniref:Uncharacterized protein n=1 Tax=Rhizobium leguminosarum TaxID=384 RepID=A0A1L3ZB57_RHILE|nr:hypothetical protein [Rhizobium leguminosarum]API52883.1 hypothetical protein BMW22_15770 [Rhizobium leguminosarum]
MNEFAGYTRPVPGGHWAMLRFARDGKPKPIMGEGEKPIIFPTEVEALRAVNLHLLAYFNGSYRRDGEMIFAAKSAADRIFRGGGRVVEVERKGASA